MNSIFKSVGQIPLIIAVLLTCSARAQEVPNWKFDNWSQFKVGTSATIKTTSKRDGKIWKEIKTTHKLLEKKDKEVVVEITRVMQLHDERNRFPPSTTKNKYALKKTANPRFMENLDQPGGARNAKLLGEGKEVIKISGKNYECKWTRKGFDIQGLQGVKGERKVWTSDDVPGKKVKLIDKILGSEEISELVSITKK